MLPVRNPEQLVLIKSINPTFTGKRCNFLSRVQGPLSKQPQAFADVLAFRKIHNIDFEVEANSGLAEGQLVSGNYFSVLGVRAIRGRTILPPRTSRLRARMPSQSSVTTIGDRGSLSTQISLAKKSF